MRTIEEILAALQGSPHYLKILPDHQDPLAPFHASLDEDLRVEFEFSQGRIPWYLAVVKRVKPLGRDKWEKIVKDNPLILELLETIWETGGSFEIFRRLSIFYPEDTTPITYSTMLTRLMGWHATESSWRADYRGGAARVLHNTLESYLQRKEVKVRCAPIVQSSGTGKSRMVDELAKRVVTVPVAVSLVRDGPTGYPPPDNAPFNDWLRGTEKDCQSEERLLRHYESFLYGLMTVTKAYLQQIDESLATTAGLQREEPEKYTLQRLAELATIFRQNMMQIIFTETVYEKAWKYGEYRLQFFNDVMSTAISFRESASSKHIKPGHIGRLVVRDDSGAESSLVSAAKTLCNFLDPLGVFSQSSKLLLVIAFDSAHTLTDPIELDNGTRQAGWTRFSTLRRILEDLVEEPVFAVFISPLAQFRDTPYPRYREGDILPPITTVGFDDFAGRVTFDGSWTLERVASTHHISHLGRALFATRYDHGFPEDRDDIIDFACMKLLCLTGDASSIQSVIPAMELAILSVRLGLDFQKTAWAGQNTEVEQVERHLRLCLVASPDFKEMVTIPPSEPLVAQAAFEAIACRALKNRWNAPAVLRRFLEDSELSFHERGQLVASLLVLLARDAACALNERPQPYSRAQVDDSIDQLHCEDGKHRIVSVLAFLEALLKMDKTTLSARKPSVSTAQDVCLEKSFRNGSIWFNHFIKAEDSAMIQRKHLCALVTRGAAMICADNHSSADIVIPIVFNNRLAEKDVSAILIHVQHDGPLYSGKLNPRLLRGLDPFRAGLFDEDDEDESLRPVIRMVLSLSPTQPAVFFEPLNASTRSGPFTAYDICCAGLSAQTFAVVAPEDEKTYESILPRIFRATGVSDEDYGQPERDLVDLYSKIHPIQA